MRSFSKTSLRLRWLLSKFRARHLLARIRLSHQRRRTPLSASPLCARCSDGIHLERVVGGSDEVELGVFAVAKELRIAIENAHDLPVLALGRDLKASIHSHMES